MVTIIGCDHMHQRKWQRCFGDERLVAFEADQKKRFYEFIFDQRRVRQATLICEEIEQGCDSFAKDLAESQGVAYANVDMPVEERQRRGIPLNYSDDGAPYAAEQIARWHSEREHFMVETVRAAQQNGRQPTLLICGRLHRERIAEILRNRGTDVQVIDLADCDSFSDKWEEDYPIDFVDGEHRP
jgi:hypothetical protein